MSEINKPEPNWKELIRAHLSMVKGILDPIDEKVRLAVLEELGLGIAKDMRILAEQLDSAREQTEEWRKHNAQRLEDVYAARELLNATPNETLVTAVRRVKIEKFKAGFLFHGQPCSVCGLRQPTKQELKECRYDGPKDICWGRNECAPPLFRAMEE